MRTVALTATLALAACATSQPPPAQPPPSAPAPTSAAPAPPPAPTEAAPTGADDAVVNAALAHVTRDALARDLRELARPRHHGRNAAGLQAVAAYVERELTGAGFAVARQPVTAGGATADNLVAERRGLRPDQVVIVCAHYDAVAGTDGADDNASGVAAMLGVARALQGLTTGATVRAIAFAFEEEGLVGSEAYVAALDPAERQRIVGVYNLEMVGYVTSRPNSQRFPPGAEMIFPGRRMPTVGNFLGAIGTTEGAAPVEALTAARRFVPDLVLETFQIMRSMTAMVPDLGRSDHAPFWRAGMPAVILSDSADFRSPHYHRASDTVATLDLDFATKSARLAAAAVLLQAGARR